MSLNHDCVYVCAWCTGIDLFPIQGVFPPHTPSDPRIGSGPLITSSFFFSPSVLESPKLHFHTLLGFSTNNCIYSSNWCYNPLLRTHSIFHLLLGQQVSVFSRINVGWFHLQLFPVIRYRCHLTILLYQRQVRRDVWGRTDLRIVVTQQIMFFIICSICSSTSWLYEHCNPRNLLIC